MSQSNDPSADPVNYHRHTGTPDPSASPTPEEEQEKKETFKQRPTVKDMGVVPDTHLTNVGADAEARHGTMSQTEDSERAYNASQTGRSLTQATATPSPTPRGEIAQDSPIVALQKKMAAKRKAIQEQTTKPVQ
jgi:hypothetical protein